ncbi:hypothetical protein E1176_15320 [Fulvivirga sp. RKSG066]|uniref:hypothetical protein n=1 Tax=Fulvivirga aurantia TaxID=2529383 RepID=UPI0012BBF065|nr:hypothetical protein [Fulvivirga aurantia]MTI22401.1 hypothetical protein [Fulvivirga aurantia]
MKFIYIFIATIFLASCTPPQEKPTMDALAEDYVKLVLEIGQYDSDFVDAYYGPEEWKPITEKKDSLPGDLLSRADELINQLAQVETENFSELEKDRHTMLGKQLLAVKTKLEMMSGKQYSFDEEAKLLYDAEPPHYSLAHFDSLLSQLENELPGEGDLSVRYNEFANQFIIPKDKLDTVFQVAIAEARKRTNAHYELPDNENFVLEYVNDKSWSGYNYYQGNSQSLIQINTDFPIFIQRAIDLACHEGYPGHHVFNALLEKNLVNEKGWKEFSVYPLFSPQSLIAEGSANYGIDVAFPGEERVQYEKEVLFPIAGLDAAQADKYYRILSLMGDLNYAGNEAARKYLNGEIDREEAARWLEKYLLYAPDRALQRTRFFDQYRSYVINYNLGKDLVANYVKSKGGIVDNPEKRWEVFGDLLSTPNTASSLREE